MRQSTPETQPSSTASDTSPDGVGPGSDPGTVTVVEAATAARALEEVRRRHGADARIVGASKVLRGGLGGFFQRELVQLTVDVDGSPLGVERRSLRAEDVHAPSVGRSFLSAVEQALADDAVDGQGHDGETLHELLDRGVAPQAEDGSVLAARVDEAPTAAPAATVSPAPPTGGLAAMMTNLMSEEEEREADAGGALRARAGVTPPASPAGDGAVAEDATGAGAGWQDHLAAVEEDGRVVPSSPAPAPRPTQPIDAVVADHVADHVAVATQDGEPEAVTPAAPAAPAAVPASAADPAVPAGATAPEAPSPTATDVWAGAAAMGAHAPTATATAHAPSLAADGDDAAPAAQEGDDDAPAAQEGDDAPAAQEGDDAPAVPEGDDAPAAHEEPTTTAAADADVEAAARGEVDEEPGVAADVGADAAVPVPVPAEADDEPMVGVAPADACRHDTVPACGHAVQAAACVHDAVPACGHVAPRPTACRHQATAPAAASGAPVPGPGPGPSPDAAPPPGAGPATQTGPPPAAAPPTPAVRAPAPATTAPATAMRSGVWSASALQRAGLGPDLVAAITAHAPSDDLGWLTALCAVVTPMCRQDGDDDTVRVGVVWERASALGPALTSAHALGVPLGTGPGITGPVRPLDVALAVRGTLERLDDATRS